MKILAFTDLHGKREIVNGIIRKTINENPDLLVCAGDLSDFGRHIDRIAANLNKLNKTTLIIPGNHETDEEISRICKDNKNIINIHNGVYEKDSYLFFGYGGGGFSKEDPRFERISLKFKKYIKKGKKIILITHAPIYNTKLDLLNNEHVGNKSTRRFIDDVQPELVICGHIHENEMVTDHIKNTRVVNPGYEGMIIKI